MAGIVKLTLKDGITPELERLIKRSRNLSPAMRKIELRIMSPLKRKAWAKSGLKSRSGELRDSIKTWHGKKSAGISVHTLPGKDLVIPKAITHTRGAKRGSYTKKREYKVRGYRRGGVSVPEHYRRNAGTPWGNIPARPFVPDKMSGSDALRAAEIIKKELLDV